MSLFDVCAATFKIKYVGQIDPKHEGCIYLYIYLHIFYTYYVFIMTVKFINLLTKLFIYLQLYLFIQLT